MGHKNVTTVPEIDWLIKNLAKQTGAAVINNVADTTSLIAHNGNTYEG